MVWEKVEAFRKLVHIVCVCIRNYTARICVLDTKDQRSQYNRKRLCANRIKRLNSVDFVWDPFGARWTEKYDRLVKYKKQYKSTCVIKKFDNKYKPSTIEIYFLLIKLIALNRLDLCGMYMLQIGWKRINDLLRTRSNSKQRAFPFHIQPIRH